MSVLWKTHGTPKFGPLHYIKIVPNLVSILWLKYNQFWRWSGYISMLNFRASFPCVIEQMPGNRSGRMDGHPENIMPSVPRSKCNNVPWYIQAKGQIWDVPPTKLTACKFDNTIIVYVTNCEQSKVLFYFTNHVFKCYSKCFVTRGSFNWGILKLSVVQPYLISDIGCYVYVLYTVWRS